MTDSFYVDLISDLSAIGIVTDVLCNGTATGSIDLNVSGGAEPIEFDWSNGDITDNPTGLEAGNYSVTVIDGDGCIFEDSYDVAEPIALSFIAEVNDACPGECDGSVVLIIGGGSTSI